MNIIEQLNAEEAARIAEARTLPDFEPGDTVRGGFDENFTVRKISYGEGVERSFPMYSPLVEGVEVVRRGKVRRAKLYYLRELRGKSARISENTGTRAKKLNDAERQAMLEEKARLEAEKIASAEALAKEKAAEEAAAAKEAERIQRRLFQSPFLFKSFFAKFLTCIRDKCISSGKILRL